MSYQDVLDLNASLSEEMEGSQKELAEKEDNSNITTILSKAKGVLERMQKEEPGKHKETTVSFQII